MGIKSFGTCDYYTVTSTNPMGYIPLSIVNSCAGSVPRQWFSGLQQGVVAYEKKNNPDRFPVEKSSGWFF
jgi:hypothetical protein